MRKYAAIVLITILALSCEKKEDNLLLPPEGSLDVNFYSFTETKSASMADETKINFTYSAITASICNTVVFVNMAIPVASFKAALRKAPTKIADKTWQWQYNFETLGASFSARMTGAIKTDSIEWKMYISKAGIGAYDEFLWYSGSSAKDRSGGYWLLNHSEAFPENYLRIDWKHNNNTIGKIKYTVIRALNNGRAPEKNRGAYIEYGLNENELNAYYDIRIYNEEAKDLIDIDIEWSTLNYNGRVKSPQFYKNDNWHCWNSNGIDDDCN